MKSRDQLEKDVNATIKFVLSEMETLASLPPEVAGHPYTFGERRRQVVRKIWGLYKETMAVYGTQ